MNRSGRNAESFHSPQHSARKAEYREQNNIYDINIQLVLNLAVTQQECRHNAGNKACHLAEIGNNKKPFYKIIILRIEQMNHNM